MKTIRLDFREFTISDEAYDRIAAIVEEGRVCSNCEQAFAENNPCVSYNLCLACLLKQQPHLSFAGEVQLNGAGSVTYKFMEESGAILLSDPSSHSPQRSAYHTLLHWGFKVPERIVQNGEEVRLSPYHWTIYGKLDSSVLVIINTQESRSNKMVVFLTYKNAGYRLVDHKKGEFKALYAQVKTSLEQTKGPDGYYHVNGHEIYRITDTHVYAAIASKMSAAYDAGNLDWS
jgi:hypothetical protein